MHNKQHMIHVANVAQHAGHLLKMQPESACSPTNFAMAEDPAVAMGELMTSPGSSSHLLDAYISAGVYSDHECDTSENALEKLRNGQLIMIQERTAAQSLEALMPLLRQQYIDRIMFYTG